MNGSTIVSEWISNDTTWTTNPNGDLLQSINSGIYQYIVSPVSCQNVFLEATFLMTGDDDVIGFTFDFKDENNYKQLLYEGGGVGTVGHVGIFSIVNGVRSRIYNDATIPYWGLNTETKLSMRIVYDELEFRLNDELQFTFRLNLDHDGALGFAAFSQAYAASNITLEEVPSNKMVGAFRLIGANQSERDVEIIPRLLNESVVHSEITARTADESDRDSVLNIVYRGNSELVSEFLVKGHNSILSVIEIRPHNRMQAIYEIMQPPRITDIFTPTKDAYTRGNDGFDTVNYGTSSSMLIGKAGSGEYRSYVQFDLGNFNPQFLITDAKLRLRYSGSLPGRAELEAFTVNERWYENGITSANRPAPIDLIKDAFINNADERYIDFDFTDIVTKWAKGTVINHGFMLRMNEEIENLIVSFKTKESTLKPELIVEYYDTRVYSTGRSQVPSEMFIFAVGDSDRGSEITVGSVIEKEERPAKLYVHRYDTPVHEEIFSEITASKPDVLAQIRIVKTAKDEHLAEITARQKNNNKRDAVLAITKPEVLSEIFICYRDERNTEITIKREEASTIPGTITVTREFVNGEIGVRYRNDLHARITVKQDEGSLRDATIIVTRELLSTEIISRAIGASKIDSEITSRVEESATLEASLSVTRELVNAEITSRVAGNSEKDSAIHSRALRHSTRDAEITVTRDTVNSVITVVYTHDVPAAITPRLLDESKVLSVIDPLPNSNRPAEIMIKVIHDVPAVISASRPEVKTVIVIPYWDDSDMETLMNIRAKDVSDMPSVLYIGGSGAYYFIM